MRAVIVTLMLAAASASAQAQDGKGYVGFGAGIGNYPDLCSSTPAGLDCDDAPFAWKFFAGYMFLPYIGIEGGFNDFGAANTQGVLLNPPAGTVPLPSNADVYTQIWSLSLVGRIPIGPAAIMGRVGYGAMMSKISGLAQVQDLQTGAESGRLQVQLAQAAAAVHLVADEQILTIEAAADRLELGIDRKGLKSRQIVAAEPDPIGQRVDHGMDPQAVRDAGLGRCLGHCGPAASRMVILPCIREPSRRLLRPVAAGPGRTGATAPRQRGRTGEPAS